MVQMDRLPFTGRTRSRPLWVAKVKTNSFPQWQSSSCCSSLHTPCQQLLEAWFQENRILRIYWCHKRKFWREEEVTVYQDLIFIELTWVLSLQPPWGTLNPTLFMKTLGLKVHKQLPGLWKHLEKGKSFAAPGKNSQLSAQRYWDWRDTRAWAPWLCSGSHDEAVQSGNPSTSYKIRWRKDLVKVNDSVVLKAEKKKTAIIVQHSPRELYSLRTTITSICFYIKILSEKLELQVSHDTSSFLSIQ